MEPGRGGNTHPSKEVQEKKYKKGTQEKVEERNVGKEYQEEVQGTGTRSSKK